ncbi:MULTISPECIES: hypothetical protein [unclassified Novosphingobium]|uniref:hypothetical protein n=1 Tax=unclassified Novosphingobium TaxID=2644732 RepID=UPI00146A43FD|nr:MULTISPECIES: hypothetical protein [unclassified Novosphingobium]NMN03897.1 putative membrane protein [Novosphingobium sp. SG919]NMN86113.1 putative membrane protein [Novosphingobium sp. SG916]
MNTIQQGAIAAQASLPVILLVLDRSRPALTLLASLEWTLVLIAVLAWAVLAIVLYRGFETEACRTLATYEAEWEIAFPGKPPLRLAGFLLNQTYARRRSQR